NEGILLRAHRYPGRQDLQSRALARGEGRSVRMRVMYDVVHLPAAKLRGGPSQHLLGGWVHVRHQTLRVDDIQALRQADHAGAETLLAFAHRFCLQLPLRDIVDRQQYQKRLVEARMQPPPAEAHRPASDVFEFVRDFEAVEKAALAERALEQS